MKSDKSAAGPTAAFRYTPGDGYVYTWDGGQEVTVYRVADILANPGAAPQPVDTFPVWTEPAVGLARTATAFTAQVDAWRSDR
jgi:hypothetical protein